MNYEKLKQKRRRKLIINKLLEFSYALCDTHKLVQKSERSDAHVFVIKTGLKVNYPK